MLKGKIAQWLIARLMVGKGIPAAVVGLLVAAGLINQADADVLQRAAEVLLRLFGL